MVASASRARVMLYPAAFDGDSTTWVLLRCLCLVSTPPCRFRGRFAGRRSRWDVFLTLDLVVRCSSTSGAEFEFWCPGTLCWSPVPSTLRRLVNLLIFLVRGYGSGFLPPTSGRSFIGGTSAWSCPLLRLTAVSLAFGLAFAVFCGSGGFPRGY